MFVLWEEAQGQWYLLPLLTEVTLDWQVKLLRKAAQAFEERERAGNWKARSNNWSNERVLQI